MGTIYLDSIKMLRCAKLVGVGCFPPKTVRQIFLTESSTILQNNLENSPESGSLTPEDYRYPVIYRGLKEGTVMYAHPEDYNFDSRPMRPIVFFCKDGARQRLFLRASTKLDNNTYTAATYLLDTGCCIPLQISEVLRRRLTGMITSCVTSAKVSERYQSTTTCPQRIRRQISPAYRSSSNWGCVSVRQRG